MQRVLKYQFDQYESQFKLNQKGEKMKIRFFMLISPLMAGMIFLGGCNPAITETLKIDKTATTMVTEEILTPTLSPTPTPTAEPVLPCNITFESDRDGNLDVYTMEPDGSNQVRLTDDLGDDSDPVWSPDGSQIAFISNRVNDTSDGQYVYIMFSDGTELKQVSQNNDSKFPDWSPLGTQIAYSSNGEIYLIDLTKETEINLTNSPEWDEQPKFSPNGQQIAWIKGEGNDRQLFVMDLNGNNILQLTNGGTVHGVEWSVDGRIFAHWDQPDGICINCIITADGKDVMDAGGKGSIQEFLPFWMNDGERVELGSGDINGTGFDDIYLVGENFPDIFLFLTDDAGNNRNPDTAFKCGPTHGIYPQFGSEEDQSSITEVPLTKLKYVIGYTGDIKDWMQLDIDQACSELDIECVHGDNITELADQGVDAIINGSNRWDVMGSYPALHDAVQRGIPVFNLNAETGENGAFNLSVEHEVYTETLNWIFQQMGGQGDFIYYNFGNSDYIQQNLDDILAQYPGINAIKKDADYNGNSFTEQDITDLINANPNLSAVWSTEQLNDIFWGINNELSDHHPLTECFAREDILISWKNEIDAGSDFNCITHIRPGGMAYEGVYVAFYYLSGLHFREDAFTSDGGNTLKYDIPVITNDSLPAWIGTKLSSLNVGQYGMIELPVMTPEEIRATWFID